MLCSFRGEKPKSIAESVAENVAASAQIGFAPTVQKTPATTFQLAAGAAYQLGR
jgi:hypothetical protein